MARTGGVWLRRLTWILPLVVAAFTTALAGLLVTLLPAWKSAVNPLQGVVFFLVAAGTLGSLAFALLALSTRRLLDLTRHPAWPASPALPPSLRPRLLAVFLVTVGAVLAATAIVGMRLTVPSCDPENFRGLPTESGVYQFDYKAQAACERRAEVQASAWIPVERAGAVVGPLGIGIWYALARSRARLAQREAEAQAVRRETPSSPELEARLRQWSAGPAPVERLRFAATLLLASPLLGLAWTLAILTQYPGHAIGQGGQPAFNAWIGLEFVLLPLLGVGVLACCAVGDSLFKGVMRSAGSGASAFLQATPQVAGKGLRLVLCWLGVAVAGFLLPAIWAGTVRMLDVECVRNGCSSTVTDLAPLLGGLGLVACLVPAGLAAFAWSASLQEINRRRWARRYRPLLQSARELYAHARVGPVYYKEFRDRVGPLCEGNLPAATQRFWGSFLLVLPFFLLLFAIWAGYGLSMKDSHELSQRAGTGFVSTVAPALLGLLAAAIVGILQISAARQKGLAAAVEAENLMETLAHAGHVAAVEPFSQAGVPTRVANLASIAKAPATSAVDQLRELQEGRLRKGQTPSKTT